MATINGESYIQAGLNIDLGTLTAPGSTDVVKMYGSKGFIIAYTVASIDTNVVVRIDGSLDNSNWFNAAEESLTMTHTANGTYAAKSETEFPFIRLTFVSEAGGTAATIAVLVFPLRGAFTRGGAAV